MANPQSTTLFWRAALVALLGTAPAAAGARQPTLLVLPVSTQGDVAPALSGSLAAALVAAAYEQGAQVQSMREVEATMEHERLKELAACTTESCALQIAGALDVDQIVVSSLALVGDELVFTSALLDARSSNVDGRVLERCEAAKPTQLLDRAPLIMARLLSGTNARLGGVGGVVVGRTTTTPSPPAVPTQVARPRKATPLAAKVLAVTGALTLVAVPLVIGGAAATAVTLVVWAIQSGIDTDAGALRFLAGVSVAVVALAPVTLLGFAGMGQLAVAVLALAAS
jgi:hypothetical protein